MYAKLIIRNARRSVKNYLIYIITLTLCVAMFYSFLSISSRYYQPDIGLEFNLAMLSDGMKMAILGITLLLLFLIKYVNQFMILRRQREFALQTIMGMEQKTTAHLFFMETLMMGLVALAAGILLGALLSQLITAMLLSFYGSEYTFSWMLFPDTVLWTVTFFLLCFAVIGLQNTRAIKKIKIIDMLRAEKLNEGSIKKSRWLPVLTVLHLVILVLMVYTGCTKIFFYYDPRLPLPVLIMYWGNLAAPAASLLIAVIWVLRPKHDFQKLVGALLLGLIPVMGFAASVPPLQMKYFLAMGAGNLNNYMIYLTWAIIYFICSVIYLASRMISDLKESSINCRYHGENLFFFGQILSRLKTSAKTMTLISLTLFLSMTMFLAAPALVEWAMGYLEDRSAYDIQIFTSYNNVREESQLPDGNYAFAADYLLENQVEIQDDCQFPLYLPSSDQFHSRMKYDFPVLAISLSDYNHLRTMKGLDAITLADDEFTTQWQSIATEEERYEFTENNKVLHTDNGVLTLSDEGIQSAPIGEYLYNSYTDIVYILPDEMCSSLLAVNQCHYFTTKEKIPYETALGLEQLFSQKYSEGPEEPGYFIRTSSQQVSSTTASTFILKAGMTYAAVVLMVSCFTILSLQQLSEADQFKYRFDILQNMGVEESHINHLIVKQLLFWFGLPIGVSILAAGIFTVYFFITISAQISAYIGAGVLVRQVAAIVLILMTLLSCYFLTTWILFKRAIAKRF